MPELFRVDPYVFERFPSYVVGYVYATGVNTRPDLDLIGRVLVEAEQSVVERFGDRDPKDATEIAVWRSAFAACGWTPSKYPASVEALVKRVARGGTLPRINPIVDLANAAVLRHLVPIGAHDTDHFGNEPLVVRSSRDVDTFAPMGNGHLEHPDAGEIVYAVGSDVRTRRWVWRQSRNALVTPGTASVFFPIDGFAESTSSAVTAATIFLAEALARWLGATVSTGIIDRDRPSFRSENSR